MEDSLLDQEIRDVYELSNRARNCLDSYGIKKIRDLFSLEDNDLLQMKNLGTKTLEEIREYKERIRKGQYSKYENDLLCAPSQGSQENNIFDIYKMSVRAKNCLISQGIRKISDLCALDKDKLLSIKNLGQKTLTEIEKIINDAKQYIEFENEDIPQTQEAILNHAWHLKGNLDFYSIRDRNNVLVYDCPIKELPFSNTFQRIFERKHINSFRELLNSDSGFYIFNQKIDAQQLNDFFSIILSHTEITNEDVKLNSLMCKITNLFDEKPYINVKSCIKETAIDFLKNNPESDVRDFILSDNIIEIFKKKLYSKINNITPIKNIDDLFPGTLKEFQKDIISIMAKRGFVVVNKEFIKWKYPSFKNYVSTIDDEKIKHIFKEVVHGKRYNELAETYGISRERVRQLINRALSKKPKLEEDACMALFSKYDVSCDALFYILKPDEYTKYYIKKNWVKGNEPSENILNDILIPVEMRKSYEQYINKDVLCIDGRRIKKDFNSIVNYLIETECINYISIDEFKKKYYSFLATNAVDVSPQLEFQIATKVKISTRLDVLWVQGAKFRYYDISESDFKSLINIINFDSLSNIEISAKYFLDRYSNELSEFDIHDEYELHNLLKKRLGERHDIEFLRMPNIIFGSGNRNNQVYNLLQQEAPISQIKLAQKYESIYGVKQAVFLASYINNINVYLNNGIYKINYPKVTPEEQSFFSDILSGNSYEISQIKEIFHSKFPDSDINKVNSYTLKKAGFFICSSIAYRYQRENFDAFLRSLFKEDDVIDFSNRLWLIHNPSASNRLNIIKKEYDWFEYEPYKYISLNKLTPFIDGKKDIVSFAESVAKFSEGNPFTLKKLRKSGFSHKLDALGFNDFFYISILKYADNLNYSRIGSQYVFVKYPGTVSLESLLREIVNKEKSVDVYRVIDLLKNDYGICIDKLKIAEKIANTEMYYSNTMEKIYINYEEFLGDISL